MRRLWLVEITGATVIKLLAAAAVVWLWLRLWRWVLLFVASVFLAIGLDPVVGWLERRGIRRVYGAPMVVAALAALLVVLLSLGGAQLSEQGQMLGDRFGEVQREITRMIPAPLLQLISERQGNGSQFGQYVTRIGRALVSGILSIFIAFVLAIYLLIDGRRTSEWLIAFFHPDKRPRVRRTAVESGRAIFGYVRGIIATSILTAVLTYVVLLVLNVPAALLTALIAGVLNVIPVVGLFISMIPAVILALTVSTTAAVIVAGFYLVYNVVENYYVAPKVYGREMRLSDLAVILAFAVGAELGGVIGALIALPLVAMYPVVESLWLRDRLGPEVADEHRRIEKTAEH